MNFWLSRGDALTAELGSLWLAAFFQLGDSFLSDNSVTSGMHSRWNFVENPGQEGSI